MSKKKYRNDDQFWESGMMNNITYQHYYDRLTELSISMFEWKNLPQSVDPRFLEMTLHAYGVSVYFKDDVMGDLALRVALGGGFDVYGIPKNRRAYSSNGYQNQLTDKNSVLIYNNYLHTNSKTNIEMFARRLYNLDRAIDVNANAQKTPVLILCDETQRLTMKNLYMQYDGNMPFIFGDKALNPKALSVLKTDAPYVADKLYALKMQTWNEALTYLGISNINVQKKERLITDEVTRNQGGTVASRYSRLQSRREAVDKINAMFGTSIEVNYREDFQQVNLDEELEQEGVGEDTTGGSENE